MRLAKDHNLIHVVRGHDQHANASLASASRLRRLLQSHPNAVCTENLGPDVMVMKSTKNRV
jgi:hypothetical protein